MSICTFSQAALDSGDKRWLVPCLCAHFGFETHLVCVLLREFLQVDQLSRAIVLRHLCAYDSFLVA